MKICIKIFLSVFGKVAPRPPPPPHTHYKKKYFLENMPILLNFFPFIIKI